MDLAIIPECYVDTNLIETLVPPRKGYNHQKGCGTVTKVMKEQFANSFALGIIDKDKREVDYLNEFEIVQQTERLILHKHNKKQHYIIQINPAIERFLLEEAEKAGVSMEAHGLPTELPKLTKITKTANSKSDGSFKSLIKAIRRVGSEDFTTLRNWISYLRDNSYNSNIDDLKAFNQNNRQ